MALKKQTSLYEILVRFGPKGFVGAHAIDMEEVIDGKEVHSAKELPPRPVTEAEFKELLGAQTAKLIEAADAARAERDEHAKARAEAEQAQTEAEGRADRIEADRLRLAKESQARAEAFARLAKEHEATLAEIERLTPGSTTG